MADASTISNSETHLSVGVVMSERVYAGLVKGHEIQGDLVTYPPDAAPHDPDDDQALVELPTEALVGELCKLIITGGGGP